VPAVLHSWYGGCRAGTALADVLLGKANPSGRLPFSVSVDEGDYPPFERDATSFRYDRWFGWWHLARTGREPAFPFGFGLSYTTFEIAETAVARVRGEIRVRGVVRNTGDRDGADVVQVYAELPDPEAPARLVGFARVEVAASGEQSFEIPVPVDRLQTRDPHKHAWRAASGRHRIVVGRYAGDPASVSFEIDLG
jgi:beta-glucosidase